MNAEVCSIRVRSAAPERQRKIWRQRARDAEPTRHIDRILDSHVSISRTAGTLRESAKRAAQRDAPLEFLS